MVPFFPFGPRFLNSSSFTFFLELVSRRAPRKTSGQLQLRRPVPRRLLEAIPSCNFLVSGCLLLFWGFRGFSSSGFCVCCIRCLRRSRLPFSVSGNFAPRFAGFRPNFGWRSDAATFVKLIYGLVDFVPPFFAAPGISQQLFRVSCRQSAERSECHRLRFFRVVWGDSARRDRSDGSVRAVICSSISRASLLRLEVEYPIR